jgi:hypothetical protein
VAEAKPLVLAQLIPLVTPVPIAPKFEWLHVSLELSALVGLTRGTVKITDVARD